VTPPVVVSLAILIVCGLNLIARVRANRRARRDEELLRVELAKREERKQRNGGAR
jgi:hypothetical protein